MTNEGEKFDQEVEKENFDTMVESLTDNSLAKLPPLITPDIFCHQILGFDELNEEQLKELQNESESQMQPDESSLSQMKEKSASIGEEA